MNNGYNNYRKYNPGGYTASSYNRNYGKKRRNYKRIRNRIIIVTVGVLICALVIFLFGLFFKNCVCASCSSQQEQVIETGTTDPNATKETLPATSETTEPEATEPEFITANIKDNNSSGKTVGGFYVWNGKAFDSFTDDDKKASDYAQYVNDIKKKLGDETAVYSMLVPSSIELNLPDRLKNSDKGIETDSQQSYIEKAYKALDDSVIPVYAYNTLAQHCNEDIYFNTDYRWTGLGAYYGYSAFAQAVGLDILSLDSCTAKQITGFNGSYATSGLADEKIKYWDFDYSASFNILTDSGDKVYSPSCYYEAAQDQEASGKHIVYLQGDYCGVIESNSKKAQGKIAIVHNSFGRIAVPYFSYNYKEVHSINTVRFNGDIAEYCKSNNITTVLFIDSVESSVG